MRVLRLLNQPLVGSLEERSDCVPGGLAWGFASRALGRCDIGSQEGRSLQGHCWPVRTNGEVP